MKSKLSFVLIFSLLILFCAPGIRAEISPYYKPKLSLPSLASPQAPVVYQAGYAAPSMGFKLFGGISSGNIRYPDTPDSAELDKYKKSLSGLAGGIGLITGGQVGAEVDFMYVQKGFKFKGTNIDDGQGNSLSFDADIVLNQIAIPVMIRLSFMPGSSTPYILIGGEFAYIISGEAKYSVKDDLGNSESETQDLFKDEETGEDLEMLSRLDYGVIGGAGFELVMNTMRFYFEGRFVYGLANLLHESQRADFGDAYGAGNDWWKLSTILFMAGIGF